MPEAADSPNVLLICTDHWSGLNTRPAGHPAVITPTIEQLARNGVSFRNAYSACPSCVPARRTLMTGMTARSHGDRVYTNGMPMPDVPTMADCFSDGGYQTFAVGKLHVSPQRDRIGFDDVLLEEQGRHQFDGKADDYELFLQERGHAGQEYAGGMCHNDFIARPWHLDEYEHPINWATREMCKTIRRRDPRKPGFWYLSFSSPHPPMTPLQAYLDLYRHVEIDAPTHGNWLAEPGGLPHAVRTRHKNNASLVDAPWREVELARRAYYATLTHIDHQIRLVIGTLREEGLLNDTIIVFTSDHGHMVGEHGLWCMRLLYEMSAKIPLFIVPNKSSDRFAPGHVEDGLTEFGDIMPTLLDMCGLPVPESVDGIVLDRDSREELYSEHDEGATSMRAMRWGPYKLIYYPAGNVTQLFDVEKDPRETTDLSDDPGHQGAKQALIDRLIPCLHGSDEAWVVDGKLVGMEAPPFKPRDNRGLMGQRGLRFM
ncbi:MAG: arylsulfatase [Gemmatimonadetes bacterium]|nr:arylsulfatase [Gemmatimonadota bacterium]